MSRTDTTRRSLLAIATAATLLPAISQAGQQPIKQPDAAQFLEWERLSLEALEVANRPKVSDTVAAAWMDRHGDYDTLIQETRSQDRTAVLVKARLAVRERLVDLDDYGAALLGQIVTYLQAAN